MKRPVLAAALAGLLAAPPALAQADDAHQALPADLSLEKALEIGRRLQPLLRQARAQTEAAEARVDQARAALLPQVNVTAGYTRATGNFVPRAGTVTLDRPTSFNTFNFFSTGINATQLLWDFGQASDSPAFQFQTRLSISRPA